MQPGSCLQVDNLNRTIAENGCTETTPRLERKTVRIVVEHGRRGLCIQSPNAAGSRMVFSMQVLPVRTEPADPSYPLIAPPTVRWASS